MIKIIVALVIVLLIISYLYTRNVNMVGGYRKKYKNWSCISGNSHAFKINKNTLQCASMDGKKCMPNLCKAGKLVGKVPAQLKRNPSCNISSPWRANGKAGRSTFPNLLHQFPPRWCANLIKRLAPKKRTPTKPATKILNAPVSTTPYKV